MAAGHGAMNYTEIPVSDLGRAADFFEAVFGWTARRDDGPYWGFATADGAEIGGLERVDPVLPDQGGPLPYVMVADLDAALERVAALGGTVEKGRTPVPGEQAHYGLIRDLDGNRLGVWSRD